MLLAKLEHFKGLLEENAYRVYVVINRVSFLIIVYIIILYLTKEFFRHIIGLIGTIISIIGKILSTIRSPLYTRGGYRVTMNRAVMVTSSCEYWFVLHRWQ